MQIVCMKSITYIAKSMMIVRVSNGQIQVEESQPNYERSSAIYSSQGVIGIYKIGERISNY